jgi:hypothetical protein
VCVSHAAGQLFRTLSNTHTDLWLHAQRGARVARLLAVLCWAQCQFVDGTQVGGYAPGEAPESARLLAAEIELCMALFGLEKQHLFYDRVLETKVVVAWNADCILLAARGSATRSNAIEDVKVSCAHRGAIMSSWQLPGLAGW